MLALVVICVFLLVDRSGKKYASTRYGSHNVSLDVGVITILVAHAQVVSIVRTVDLDWRAPISGVFDLAGGVGVPGSEVASPECLVYPSVGGRDVAAGSGGSIDLRSSHAFYDSVAPVVALAVGMLMAVLLWCVLVPCLSPLVTALFAGTGEMSKYGCSGCMGRRPPARSSGAIASGTSGPSLAAS